MGRNLRILIVDDEPLARQRLTDLIEAEPEVEIAGVATNGDGAVAEIRDLDPDLVFLDVQMPVKTGLEVVREIGPELMPATIFVTAYDQYALDAFEIAAVDYLVKPFDDERFRQALGRARRRLQLEEVDEMARRLRRVLEGAPAPTAEAPGTGRPGYLQRIAVESRGRIRVVPVSGIDYITATGRYVTLHAGDSTHVVRDQMQSLEQRLDPEVFVRVHRSTIVRLDRIETLLRAGGGDYGVRLKNGAELGVSRGRVGELERRLGIHD